MIPLHKKHRNAGFTLVELILYVSLMAIFLLSLVTLITTIQSSRLRSITIAEVEQQWDFILSHIVRTLTNTTSVTTPTIGNVSSILTVTSTFFNGNPVAYSLTDWVMSVTEWWASAIPLHNERVIVTDLEFHNLWHPDTHGSIRVQFTLWPAVHPYWSDSQEFDRVFQTAISLHQN